MQQIKAMKRKIGNSSGVGVIHDPSGMEIPRGWGGLIGRTIHGRGMDIFWNHIQGKGTLFLGPKTLV